MGGGIELGEARRNEEERGGTRRNEEEREGTRRKGDRCARQPRLQTTHVQWHELRSPPQPGVPLQQPTTQVHGI